MWSQSLILCLGLVAFSEVFTQAETFTKNEPFDAAFSKFLEENKYSGGALAALKDGKLLFAKGFGTEPNGIEVTSHSKFRVSSIAKSLTGVAIMRLVQDGTISLQDRVFGDGGILKSIRPRKESLVDPRIYDITIDNLLHHCAGWDSKSEPQYDLLLNTLYQGKQETVQEIWKEMGLTLPLRSRELLSHILSSPLTFNPGTRTAYSSMAYFVLGKIVEAVSDMKYKEFVKKKILDPCGMWSTNLWAAGNTEQHSTTHNQYPSIYDPEDPLFVDSTLGWTSNVYDLMRFTRCTFETGELLSEKHKKLLVDLPSTLSQNQLDETWWHGSGFLADSEGNIWQEGDKEADDLILYHSLKPHDESRTEQIPDSWIILLHGRSINPILQATLDLLLQLDFTTPSENLYLQDLSDIHKHPKWEPPKSVEIPEYTIKYKVNEHHLTAYVNAIRNEEFNIVWLTSYTLHHQTFFLLVSTQTKYPTRPQYDYMFEHGMDHRQLLKRKLQLEESGYNMTELHSYKSQSHSNHISFAAIFRNDAFSSDIQMKYGTGHLPEPFEKLVQMYYEKQFYPISQTVVYQDEDEQFSFIFIKDSEIDRKDFKHYYDLSTTHLAKITAENANSNLYLSYLNTYDVAGKFKLAAIFTNTTDSMGILEIDKPQNEVTETIINSLQKGLVPKYLVPSNDEDSQLKLVVYYGQQ